MTKSAEMQLIEERLKRPVEELMVDGLREGKSLTQLAAEWGVQPLTAMRWAKLFGIRRDWVLSTNEPIGAGR